MTAILEAALAYAARGWPVFPCRPGRKDPATPNGFKDATTDPARIRAWWAAIPEANVAIATGEASIDVLDIDSGGAADGYQSLAQLQAAGLTDGHGAMVRTRSGGLHIYFAGTAQRNGGLRAAAVDYRGSGGYVLAPPSYVEADHKPAGRYELITDGDPGGALDWRVVRALLDPPPDPPAFRQPPTSGPAAADRGRPGDDWAAGTSWDEILRPHGWRPVRDLGGGRRCWCRPGKAGTFTSATTRDDGGLYVFSTSTAFDPEVPYSKFGAYAVLEHAGDHAAAARRLRADGHGAPPSRALALPAPRHAAPQAPGGQPATPDSDGAAQDAVARLAPVSLAGLIRDGVPEPDMMPGGLGYLGGIHGVAGPPDCGKTTLALWLMLTVLRAGHPVLMLDEEGGAEMIAEKLIALGATEADAGLLTYVEFPACTWHAGDLAALAALMDATQPAMVLFDSAAAFMARAGLDENDAGDVTRFWANVLTPLARHWRAAVYVIDHDAKNGGEESRFSRGSGAKLAATDVQIKVSLVHAFTRTESGQLRLFVSKDRRGWLHRNWNIGVKTGDRLHLVVTEAVSGKAEGLGLKPHEERVLSVLDGTPQTWRQVNDRLADQYAKPLRRPTLSTALNALARAGLADRLDPGPGSEVLWTVTDSGEPHP